MVLVDLISICPFDFGKPPDQLGSILPSLGFERLDSVPWPITRIGSDLSVYESSLTGHRLAVADDGFAQLIICTSSEIGSLEDHGRLAKVLVERDRLHKGNMTGNHAPARVAEELKNQYRELRPSRGRDDLWSPFPYTLSSFLVHAEPKSIWSTEEKKSIHAMLEPSRVRCTDPSGDDSIDVPLCASLITTLDIVKSGDLLTDIDLHGSASVFSSWAGVVAINASGRARDYYEGLEVRLQFAWQRAFYVRKWAENAAQQQGKITSQISVAGIRPVLRTTQRIIDAATSSRDQRLFDELVRTSDLGREVNAAEEALKDLDAKIAQEAAARRESSDFVLEGLLFCLAMLQVLPLVFGVPFVILSRWCLIPIGVIVGIILVWRKTRLRS